MVWKLKFECRMNVSESGDNREKQPNVNWTNVLLHTLFAIHSFILSWESNNAVFTLPWIYQHSKKHTGTFNMIRSNYRAIYFCSNCTKEFHTKIDSASKQRCCPRCGILNNPFMEVSAFAKMIKIHITRLRSEEWQFSAFLNIPTLPYHFQILLRPQKANWDVIYRDSNRLHSAYHMKSGWISIVKFSLCQNFLWFNKICIEIL